MFNSYKLNYHDKKIQQTLCSTYRTTVLTLLGFISNIYSDLLHWRLNQRPQNAEPKLYQSYWSMLHTSNARLTSHGNCAAKVDQLLSVLHCHLLIHAEIHIYILDKYWHNDKRRIKEGSRKEDTRRLLYNYIYLSLYCKVRKGCLRVCMWEDAGDQT